MQPGTNFFAQPCSGLDFDWVICGRITAPLEAFECRNGRDWFSLAHHFPLAMPLLRLAAAVSPSAAIARLLTTQVVRPIFANLCTASSESRAQKLDSSQKAWKRLRDPCLGKSMVFTSIPMSQVRYPEITPLCHPYPYARTRHKIALQRDTHLFDHAHCLPSP